MKLHQRFSLNFTDRLILLRRVQRSQAASQQHTVVVISDMPQTKTNANDFGKPDMIVITLHLTVVPVLLVMLPMSVFRSHDLQSVLQRPNQSLRYPTFLHLCSVMSAMATSTLFFHLNPAIKMNWRKHNKSATRLLTSL